MQRVILSLAAAAALIFGVAACTGSSGTSGQQLDTKVSSQIEQNAEINQPVPVFQHSDIRAALTEIEAIQALGEQTTVFFFNQGVKDPIFSCPALGEPVASTTQLTNPDTNYNASYPNGGAAYAIPNMDPNEIYAGDSTGTYVVCVNAQGQPYTQYWEGFVDAVSGPATWDAATGQIQVTGAPNMPTCTRTKVGSTWKEVCTK